MPLLFLIFLAVPIAELYLLIQVGSVIGVLPTVALTVLTAVIGVALLRMQGLATVMRIQETMARGEIPAVEMLEGALLLVGGALLLTPGFATDTLGFLILIPPVRRWAVLRLIEHGTFSVGGSFRPPPASQGSKTIEGEWRREDE